MGISFRPCAPQLEFRVRPNYLEPMMSFLDATSAQGDADDVVSVEEQFSGPLNGQGGCGWADDTMDNHDDAGDGSDVQEVAALDARHDLRRPHRRGHQAPPSESETEDAVDEAAADSRADDMDYMPGGKGKRGGGGRAPSPAKQTRARKQIAKAGKCPTCGNKPCQCQAHAEMKEQAVPLGKSTRQVHGSAAAKRQAQAAQGGAAGRSVKPARKPTLALLGSSIDGGKQEEGEDTFIRAKRFTRGSQLPAGDTFDYDARGPSPQGSPRPSQARPHRGAADRTNAAIKQFGRQSMMSSYLKPAGESAAGGGSASGVAGAATSEDSAESDEEAMVDTMELRDFLLGLPAPLVDVEVYLAKLREKAGVCTVRDLARQKGIVLRMMDDHFSMRERHKKLLREKAEGVVRLRLRSLTSQPPAPPVPHLPSSPPPPQPPPRDTTAAEAANAATVANRGASETALLADTAPHPARRPSPAPGTATSSKAYFASHPTHPQPKPPAPVGSMPVLSNRRNPGLVGIKAPKLKENFAKLVERRSQRTATQGVAAGSPNHTESGDASPHAVGTADTAGATDAAAAESRKRAGDVLEIEEELEAKPELRTYSKRRRTGSAASSSAVVAPVSDSE